MLIKEGSICFNCLNCEWSTSHFTFFSLTQKCVLISSPFRAICLLFLYFISSIWSLSSACHYHGQSQTAGVCSCQAPPLITTWSICTISAPSIINITHQRLPSKEAECFIIINIYLILIISSQAMTCSVHAPTFGLGSPMTLQEKVTGMPSKTL